MTAGMAVCTGSTQKKSDGSKAFHRVCLAATVSMVVVCVVRVAVCLFVCTCVFLFSHFLSFLFDK